MVLAALVANSDTTNADCAGDSMGDWIRATRDAAVTVFENASGDGPVLELLRWGRMKPRWRHIGGYHWGRDTAQTNDTSTIHHLFLIQEKRRGRGR